MSWRSALFALFAAVLTNSLQAQSLFSLGVGQVSLPDAIETVSGSIPSSLVVNFPVGSFDTTPAIFILPDNTNADPMTLRVHSVSTSGFEVFVAESEGEDGIAWPSIIPFEYLAIEPGVYSIGGATMEVGLEAAVTEFRSKLYTGDSWRNVAFTSAFTGSFPAVISELQTIRSDSGLLSGAGSTFNRTTEPWLEVAMANMALGNFDMALERAETPSGSISGLGEDIAWLAIEDTTDISFTDDSLTSIELKAFLSADTITGNCVATNLVTAGVTNFSAGDPIYFGSQIRWDGGDGGWVRRCSDTTSSVTVKIQEDLATDTDLTHTTEQVAFVGLSQAFQATDTGAGTLGFNMLVGSNSFPVPSISYSYSLAPTAVSFTTEFGGNFSATPVVIPMSTSEGNGDPAMVRVWGRTASGFNMSVTIPENTLAPDGTPRAPDGMTVDFLVVVPGSHILPDGSEIRAGTGTTNLCIGGVSSCEVSPASYITVPLGFAAPPADAAVLAATQTINNDSFFDPEDEASPYLATSIVNKTGASFDFSFELAQTSLGSANPLPFSETFGWVALESGLEGTLRAAQGTTSSGNHLIEYKTLYPAGTIGGWDDSVSCYSFSYTTSFTVATAPRVLATHNTRNGGDGGWLRRCATSGSAVSLVLDEDTNADTERSHGGQEQASIVAFSDTFAWGPQSFRHTKISEAEWDPVNLLEDPKAIPESYLRYRILVENLERIGANDGSLEVIDSVPTNTTLFVGDLDAGCPVEWSENGDPSGLLFTCASDLRLHDGGSCAPQDADGYCAYSAFAFGSDWDSSINSIKVAPTGEFLGSNGATTPEFEFEFRVRID